MNALTFDLFTQANTLNIDPVDAALHSQGVVLLVLVVLMLMSVMSWFIIGARAWALVQMRRDVVVFRRRFDACEQVLTSAEQLQAHVALPHFKLLVALLKESASYPEGIEPELSSLERALNRASEPLVAELESGLTLLGSIASSAPFIGLFGTVWGIMLAFGSLSDSGSVLQTVAPHIAEALVATAVGLFAAIPAVIGYNSLTRIVRHLVTDLDGFGLELINRVARERQQG
ncbi:MAG: hypothetical protein CMH53_08430 [Myxococcales bacterium]|nr:hypothetical protein [Myxococcales bacterium]